MRPDELEAIRARDATSEWADRHGMYRPEHADRRDLLAEVDRMLAIEATDISYQGGVAAERARVRAAVEALYGQVHPMCAIEDEPTRHDVVSRKAVLAAIEGETT